MFEVFLRKVRQYEAGTLDDSHFLRQLYSMGHAMVVMSIGGVDAASPAIAEYFAKHTEVIGTPPDSWASAVTYASLQILQQAVARVGLDQGALAEEIATGNFDTVMGEVRMEDNQLRSLWWAGQWQGDDFVAIAPADAEGAADPVIPKPDW